MLFRVGYIVISLSKENAQKKREAGYGRGDIEFEVKKAGSCSSLSSLGSMSLEKSFNFSEPHFPLPFDWGK